VIAQPDRSGFLELGRTRLRTWEWGDADRPVVLLVHGGWDHGRMWDGFAPRVVELGFHAVAIDQRGHGDSGPVPASNWSMFNLDLAQVATHYGAATRPVGLIGHSFGGGQCLSVAATFNELIAWVVNIDGLGPPPEMMIVEDHAAHAAAWLSDAEKIWWTSAREYDSLEEMATRRREINRRLPMEWCVHMAEHGTKRGPGGGLIWKADPAMRLGVPSPFEDEILLAQYGFISCPVLALTGGEDDQWSDLSADAIERRVGAMANSEHHVVAGAGHYIHIEQPDRVVEHVRRFLAA
jgi:pimeloyl-ACP methyl ester carboxylesterase